MKGQLLLLALTAINAALLVCSLAQTTTIAAQGIAPVLRGRAFEIVDEQGRVRAEIKVLPAQPDVKMPDGTTGYPETVQLRLFTSKGAPNVKLAAMEDGAGLVLGSDGYVQALSRGATSVVRIVTRDGRQHTITP